jgi:hypothetical protein
MLLFLFAFIIKHGLHFDFVVLFLVFELFLEFLLNVFASLLNEEHLLFPLLNHDLVVLERVFPLLLLGLLGLG